MKSFGSKNKFGKNSRMSSRNMFRVTEGSAINVFEDVVDTVLELEHDHRIAKGSKILTFFLQFFSL